MQNARSYLPEYNLQTKPIVLSFTGLNYSLNVQKNHLAKLSPSTRHFCMLNWIRCRREEEGKIHEGKNGVRVNEIKMK